MWPGHMWGLGWVEILVVGLLTLIFWGGVILLAVFAIRAVLRDGGGSVSPHEPTKGQALDILNERYARGEIDREEYQRIRKDLES